MDDQQDVFPFDDDALSADEYEEGVADAQDNQEEADDENTVWEQRMLKLSDHEEEDEPFDDDEE